MHLLIAYDIEDDKRRKKVSDLLEAVGYRVNYSVFEITITQTKYIKLAEKLKEILEQKKDSVRIYHVCENCVKLSKELCEKPDIFEPKEMFV